MTDLAIHLRGLAPSGAIGPPAFEPAQELEPFTDAQVDDFREQDRWLPVSCLASLRVQSLRQARGLATSRRRRRDLPRRST